MKKEHLMYLLAALFIIKFAYLPWSEWIQETNEETARYVTLLEKQESAIEDENRLIEWHKSYKEILDTHSDPIPKLTDKTRPNNFWFDSVELLKNENVKIYNQKVEYEKEITAAIHYVKGSFYISGEPDDVIKALFSLETKFSSSFIDMFQMSNGSGANNGKMVALINVGFYYIKSSDK